MRKGASLILTELLVMLFVFLVASFCCLKIFSWTDVRMTEAERMDEAVLQAQNLAERIKEMKGSWPKEHLNGKQQDEIRIELENGLTVSAVRVDSKVPGLGKADIHVVEEDERVKFSLSVCWQEELP
ncbi:MAG: hypothetical protein PUK34_11565 [Clostridia bacterium]|nr:hypothetical protein [Clostridia bacterium]